MHRTDKVGLRISERIDRRFWRRISGGLRAARGVECELECVGTFSGSLKRNPWSCFKFPKWGAIRTQVGAIWMADWAMNWEHLALVARTGREKKAPKGGRPTWAPDASQMRDPEMGLMGVTGAFQGGPIWGPDLGATVFAKNRVDVWRRRRRGTRNRGRGTAVRKWDFGVAKATGRA